MTTKTWNLSMGFPLIIGKFSSSFGVEVEFTHILKCVSLTSGLV